MTVLADYSARLGQPELLSGARRYDEVLAPDGTLRPAWKGLAEVAVALTEADLRRVEQDIGRHLADDGVTYARPGGSPTPWRLDPLPLVVDASEWSRLEVGLAQRAELLNAVLVDLYGEQRLLSTGTVPATAVYSHPGYLRVLARASTTDQRPLLFAATDLGRTPDGTWTVLGDRAQAPSGMGFALENRRVISRVLPELYREAQLHRVGPFLAALRSALIQSAPGEESQARVVVLSPGPQSETAYDQGFLASSLGFPLVEGADLEVRDGHLFLKGSQQPERVDVVLRRVDAAWSDPLELRGDSTLGVPGLVEAVRRGTVRVVNGLGAGALENPALLAYDAEICRLLLDEEPLLPVLPTWWGGDADGLDVLLDRVEELTVRRIDRDEQVTGSASQLRALLAAAPHRYVGQERPLLSQAPLARSLGVRPTPVRLRTFTLRHGEVYRPLVGGLATVVGGDGTARASKDVWVLKRSADDPDQGLGESLPISTLRMPEPVVPRVLDDMFWLGRYTERTEALLRQVITASALSERTAAVPDRVAGQVLRGAVGRLCGTDDLRAVLLDVRRSGSIAHGVATMRDTASSVRDQLSPDVWRAFATIDRSVALLVESSHEQQVAESAGRMLTGVFAVTGIVENMMRDPGWHLIGVGRSLERGLQLVMLLQATVAERRGLEVDRAVLDGVLGAAESGVTHRRRYRGHVRPRSVLELLLLDPLNPRSLLFTLGRAAEHLEALPRSTGSSRPERLLAALREEVVRLDVAGLVAIGGVERPHLTRFLEDTVVQLERLADAVRELHCATGPAPRPMAGLVGAPR